MNNATQTLYDALEIGSPARAAFNLIRSECRGTTQTEARLFEACALVGVHPETVDAILDAMLDTGAVRSTVIQVGPGTFTPGIEGGAL